MVYLTVIARKDNMDQAMKGGVDRVRVQTFGDKFE